MSSTIVSDSKYICFTSTNESLDGIVCGMDVQPADEIISICGSGDQSFAMIEFGAKVTAVDSLLGQVIYARKRLQMLKDRNYDKLFSVGSPCFSEGSRLYFNHERLGRISDNSNNLSIQHMDIFNMPESFSGFDKAYLSNVVMSPEELRLLLRRMKVGGLVYSANEVINDSACQIPSLALNQDLSRRAYRRDGGCWVPQVYSIVDN